MKFTVNRKVMLEYLKSMSSLVPKNSLVEELNGFLVEANEDDGYLYLTANNMESAIQRKFKPQVETGGRFVIRAKLLMNVLAALAGTDVEFSEAEPGLVQIKGGGCTYTLRVWNSERYPCPEMPFPEDTAKVAGIKQLYEKTKAMAAKGESSLALNGLHMDITPKGFRVTGCDSKGISVARKEMQCGKTLSFTISKPAFSYLAAAVGNDELEVGMSGSLAVFMKEGLLFSCRVLASEYPDVDKILGYMKPVYTAKVEYDELKRQISSICDIASLGSEPSYVTLSFCEDRIELATQNDTGDGIGVVPAVMADGSAGMRYSYSVSYLQNLFKTVEGALILEVDARGELLVMDRYDTYMTTPMREYAVKRQQDKFAEQKAERTKKAGSKKSEPAERAA